MSTVFMSFALRVRSATARHCASRSLLLGRWPVGVAPLVDDFLLLFNVIRHRLMTNQRGIVAYNYVKQILKFSKICIFCIYIILESAIIFNYKTSPR